MQLWTAFILGLAGSIHCAAMCGALTLLVPVCGQTAKARIASRIAYHSGRIAMYAAIGALFGIFGRSLAIAGLQRWLSIGIGALILLGSIVSLRSMLTSTTTHYVTWIKAKFSRLLQRRTLASIALLGALNGLLPCGLVYVAAVASIATASAGAGTLFMISFGVGTLPMLLAIAICQSWMRFSGLRLKYIVPALAVITGALLVIRGLSLAIPYASPDSNGHCPACRQTAAL